MERFLQVVGESGFPLQNYMTYEILGTIMYNIPYIMCKSIYLFINCGFCVWKLHLTQGPGMPGIQIPTFFYRAQAHRWQKPSRPPRWHRLEVLPPRGILQLGRAMSRQMFITSSKRRRKEIPFRFTIENNRKTHRFTSFLS